MIASELRLFFQSVAELLREMLRSISRGAREVLKTDGTGPALIGLLVVVIAIGGLVYITLVGRIFDHGQPSASAAADSPAATATVATPAPAPLTPENAPAAAAPAAPASGQWASTLFPSSPQGPTATPALGGIVRLPTDFTKSDGTSALEGSSPCGRRRPGRSRQFQDCRCGRAQGARRAGAARSGRRCFFECLRDAGIANIPPGEWRAADQQLVRDCRRDVRRAPHEPIAAPNGNHGCENAGGAGVGAAHYGPCG